MKLICRGNTYDYDPAKTADRACSPVRRSGASYTVNCRATTYQINPEVTQTVPSQRYQLICRGMTYFVSYAADGTKSIDVVHGLIKSVTPELSFV
jgi:hypothetical protein